MKRTGRVGAAARRRVRNGGVLAKGRDAETRAGWLAVKAAVLARSGGVCEYHRTHLGQDYHHVVKRSHGGADVFTNVVFLCRAAHDRTDAAYALGRLVITPHDGGFLFELVTRASKWA